MPVSPARSLRSPRFRVANGSFAKAVVIESDGEQAVSETVVPPVVETYEQFTAALRASGLVGLGGAGFPTTVKFSVKDPSKVEYLLINGAECEPYITSDTRTMVDDADHIVKGAMTIRKFLGVKNIAIVIEDNKPEAIEIFPQKDRRYRRLYC